MNHRELAKKCLDNLNIMGISYGFALDNIEQALAAVEREALVSQAQEIDRLYKRIKELYEENRSLKRAKGEQKDG